jgi:hypothetical protein
MYARALLLRAHALVDDILAIADDDSRDILDGGGKGAGAGGIVLNAAALRRDKLKISARIWTAARLLPKVYGERAGSAAGGTDGRPMERRGVTREMTKEEAAAAYREQLGRGK